MDPNETLKRIRHLVSRAAASVITTDESEDLAMQISYLDSWISNGGFLPSDWWPAGYTVNP